MHINSCDDFTVTCHLAGITCIIITYKFISYTIDCNGCYTLGRTYIKVAADVSLIGCDVTTQFITVVIHKLDNNTGPFTFLVDSVDNSTAALHCAGILCIISIGVKIINLAVNSNGNDIFSGTYIKGLSEDNTTRCNVFS